jgi:hypothetical protein
MMEAKSMKVRRYLNSRTTLWFAFALALLGSLTHTASTFALLEAPAWRWLAYLEAVAVDVALAALAYAVERKRHERRPTAALWAGVITFALISAWGNLIHGATQAVGGSLSVQAVAALDPISAATTALFSLVLPVAVVYLAEILSDDRNHAEIQAQTAQPAIEPAHKAEELQSQSHDAGAVNLPATVHAIRLADGVCTARVDLDDKTLAQMAVVVEVHTAKPTATLAEVSAALGVKLSRAGEIRRLAVQAGYLRADGKRRFVPNGCIPQTQEVQRHDDGGEP